MNMQDMHRQKGVKVCRRTVASAPKMHVTSYQQVSLIKYTTVYTRLSLTTDQTVLTMIFQRSALIYRGAKTCTVGHIGFSHKMTKMQQELSSKTEMKKYIYELIHLCTHFSRKLVKVGDKHNRRSELSKDQEEVLTLSISMKSSSSFVPSAPLIFSLSN